MKRLTKAVASGLQIRMAEADRTTYQDGMSYHVKDYSFKDVPGDVKAIFQKNMLEFFFVRCKDAEDGDVIEYKYEVLEDGKLVTTDTVSEIFTMLPETDFGEYVLPSGTEFAIVVDDNVNGKFTIKIANLWLKNADAEVMLEED